MLVILAVLQEHSVGLHKKKQKKLGVIVLHCFLQHVVACHFAVIARVTFMILMELTAAMPKNNLVSKIFNSPIFHRYDHYDLAKDTYQIFENARKKHV
jgi:hypothetical protein